MSKPIAARSQEKVVDIYLLRHGHSSANGKGILAGRDNSVHLSDKGQQQAADLIQTLEPIKFDRIISSPITRCLETVRPFLKHLENGPIRKKPNFVKDNRLSEMDYGTWSGSKLSTLAKKPLWQTIQERPSTVRFPEGESFLEMQARISSLFTELFQGAKIREVILVCSHGDVIKATIAHFLGLHLDQFQRLAIDPASISHIRLTESGAFVVRTNDTSHLGQKKSSEGVKSTLGGGAG
jgi:probable phosphoglycerate mutase